VCGQINGDKCNIGGKAEEGCGGFDIDGKIHEDCKITGGVNIEGGCEWTDQRQSWGSWVVVGSASSAMCYDWRTASCSIEHCHLDTRATPGDVCKFHVPGCDKLPCVAACGAYDGWCG
jgi:hypothetical protein